MNDLDHFPVSTLLRQLPYFAQVAASSLEELAGRAGRRSFAANEMIFLEGEPSAGLWIVESGRVKAYKLSPDGQEYIINFFGPGSTFNDLAALDGAANAVSTTAVSEVTAWVIPATVFAAALEHDHALCLAVTQGLVGRVRHLVGRLEDLALRPVIARLAHFLLEQVESPTLGHPTITRSLIASHLATTPESVSRSLRLLEEIGAIRFDRHQVIIVDPALLRQQAQL